MASPADERIGLLLKRAEQALINAKSAALRPFGLTVPQYATLLFAADQPGLSSAELARRVLVTPQTIGPVLTTLEARKLLERRPHHRHARVIEIHLTDAGHALLREADQRALEVEAQLTASFSTKEQRQLRTLLERTITSLADTPAAGPAGRADQPR